MESQFSRQACTTSGGRSGAGLAIIHCRTKSMHKKHVVRSLPLLFGHTLDQSANGRVVQFQVTCDFHLTVAVLVYRL